MKILYVGDLGQASNCRLRMDTLQVAGYDIVPLHYYDYIRSRIGRSLAWHLNVGSGLNHLNRKMEKMVETHRPDLVWVDKGTYLQPRTLRRVKSKIGTRMVHINPDDPFGHYRRGWRLFKKSIPLYDLHFVSRPQNLKEYRDLGASNVHEYDRSFDPRVHRPVDLSGEERRNYAAAVGFIGTYAAARARSILHLIRNGIPVAIYGDGWEGSEHWDEIRNHFRSRALFRDDYAKAICGMEIALHFLRKENRDYQDSRTFELPACGTFMLAEWSHKHQQFFRDGKEAVFFRDDNELVRKVQHYIDHPEERAEIAAAGRHRSLNSGYDHLSRLQSMLALVRRELEL